MLLPEPGFIKFLKVTRGKICEVALREKKMGTLVQMQLNHHRDNPQSFFWKILKSLIGATAGMASNLPHSAEHIEHSVKNLTVNRVSRIIGTSVIRDRRLSSFSRLGFCWIAHDIHTHRNLPQYTRNRNL